MQNGGTHAKQGMKKTLSNIDIKRPYEMLSFMHAIARQNSLANSGHLEEGKNIPNRVHCLQMHK